MQLTSSSHVWPQSQTSDGQRMPTKARLSEGTLAVPPGFPRGVLAYMDELYRHVLWPPCKIDGFVRYAREFVWAEGGRVLHYRIVDVPIRSKTN